MGGGDLRLLLTGEKKHCKTGVCMKMKVCAHKGQMYLYLHTNDQDTCT